MCEILRNNLEIQSVLSSSSYYSDTEQPLYSATRLRQNTDPRSTCVDLGGR